MKNLQLHQMTTLLRREYWEHRIAILWVPAMLAIMVLITLIWALTATGQGREIVDFMSSLESRADLEASSGLTAFFGIIAAMFLLALGTTVPIYLINCLYEDRKSGSSLFWYSMPVSNASTVLSKLITGLLLMPLLTACILLALFAALLLVGVLYFAFEDASLPFWLLAGGLLDGALTFTIGTLLLGFWLLPLYGWLLLVSAFARAAPVFWAIALIIVLTLLERIVLRSSYLSTWLDSRGIPFQNLTFDRSELLASMLSYDMIYGLALGALFTSGAIYMRRFTD